MVDYNFFKYFFERYQKKIYLLGIVVFKIIYLKAIKVILNPWQDFNGHILNFLNFLDQL